MLYVTEGNLVKQSRGEHLFKGKNWKHRHFRLVVEMGFVVVRWYSEYACMLQESQCIYFWTLEPDVKSKSGDMH